MYQVNFSDQAIAELNKIDKLTQLELIDAFSSLTAATLKKGRADIGHFRRKGKTYYRLRSGDYRIYFEVSAGDTLYAHYLLHHHTLTDFVMRMKLPMTEEQIIEQHKSFWKYLETLKKPQADDE